MVGLSMTVYVKIVKMRMYTVCKHPYIYVALNLKDRGISVQERQDYFQWRYSTGNGGSREYCFKCWVRLKYADSLPRD